MHQIRSVSLGGGTTTTRRPNKRASTEYAPGPSKASAAAFRKREAKTSSSRREAPPKIFTSAYAQTTKERYGVRKPMVSANAISVATMKIRWMVDKSVRFATINTKVAATEIRSSNKPIPGPPGGNIENSRCTLVSLSALNSAAHPKWSYTPITLLGDAWHWSSGVRRGDQEIWGFLEDEGAPYVDGPRLRLTFR